MTVSMTQFEGLITERRYVIIGTRSPVVNHGHASRVFRTAVERSGDPCKSVVFDSNSTPACFQFG